MKDLKLDRSGLIRWTVTEGPALVADLEKKRLVAASERARVNALIAPIFARYSFPVNPEWAHEPGETVKEPRHLYLAAEDPETKAMLAKYDGEVADAHAANGFAGERGHCPALIAENAVIDAENAVITSFGKAACGLDLMEAGLSLKMRAEVLALAKQGVVIGAGNFRK